MSIIFNASNIVQANTELLNIMNDFKAAGTDLKGIYVRSRSQIGFGIDSDHADGAYDSGTGRYGEAPGSGNFEGEWDDFVSIGNGVYKLTENLVNVINNLSKYIDIKVENYSNIDTVSASKLSEAQSILDSIDLM